MFNCTNLSMSFVIGTSNILVAFQNVSKFLNLILMVSNLAIDCGLSFNNNETAPQSQHSSNQLSISHRIGVQCLDMKIIMILSNHSFIWILLFYCLNATQTKIMVLRFHPEFRQLLLGSRFEQICNEFTFCLDKIRFVLFYSYYVINEHFGSILNSYKCVILK